MGTRIDTRFAELKAEGRAGLVAFITAGDPDPETSFGVLKGLPAKTTAAGVRLPPPGKNGHRLKPFAPIYASLAAIDRADVENRPAGNRKPVFVAFRARALSPVRSDGTAG